MPSGRFSTTPRTEALWPVLHPFAVVADGGLVVDRRTSGSAVAMTYRIRRNAEAGAARARAEIPSARVAER